MTTAKGGQKAAQENLEKFEAWVAAQTNDTFKQIIHQGKLNRREITKQAGIGSSAIKQNPLIRARLGELEDELRNDGVLPRPTPEAIREKAQPKAYDPTTTKSRADAMRLAALEKEVVELRAENAGLKNANETFTEQREAMIELGLLL